MSEISSEYILKLGMLARIDIDIALADQLTPQLKEIIDYVAQLQSVDTENTPVTSQVTGLSDVWREDKVVASKTGQSTLLQNAPGIQDGYIKVGRVKE